MLSRSRLHPHDLALALPAALFLTACGGCGGGSGANVASGAGAGTSASTGNAATTTSTSGSAGTTGSGATTTGTGGGAAADRGPSAIMLDADPNGLWWDAPTDTLYLADSANNRILAWTDGGGSKLVANLPAAPANGPGLGQVVKTADGKLVVTRFGFGTAGDIAFVNADESTGTVPGLDVTRRRIGLTVAPDGTIYDGYFVLTATSQIGAVARLDLAGSETDFVTALSKPVGVLVAGANMLVSDQATNAVFEAPLATPSKLTSFVSMISGPDLLCAGPDGSYFTGGTTGDIRQISSSGQLTTFAGGFVAIRGVAYDAKNKRLFAAEHISSTTMNTLRILPVN